MRAECEAAWLRVGGGLEGARAVEDRRAHRAERVRDRLPPHFATTLCHHTLPPQLPPHLPRVSDRAPGLGVHVCAMVRLRGA